MATVMTASPVVRMLRRIFVAGALGAAVVSVGPGSLAGARPAGAAQTVEEITQTVDEGYSCTFTSSVASGSYSVTVPFTTSGPSSVSPGSTFTLMSSPDPDDLFDLFPSGFVASTFGGDAIIVDALDLGVPSTDVTTSVATLEAEGVPEEFWLGPPLPGNFPLDLAPVAFTAVAPGTATFSAGPLSASLMVVLVNGTEVAASLDCTPEAGNPPLFVMSVATSSTVPAGAVGGAVLAGVVGVAGAGRILLGRRRRQVPTTPVG